MNTSTANEMVNKAAQMVSELQTADQLHNQERIATDNYIIARNAGNGEVAEFWRAVKVACNLRLITIE